MNKQDVLEMLGRTRKRLLHVLEKCDDGMLDFKPEMKLPKGGSFHKARNILRHIAGAKSYWIRCKVLREKDCPKYDFSNKSLREIIEVLQDVRKYTLCWLDRIGDDELTKPYTQKAKTSTSMILYHLVEHEAHHLGQICMIGDIAGIDIPWV